MWQWRSKTAVSPKSFSAAGALLAALCLITAASSPTEKTPATANGPTYETEASILWSDGLKAFDAGEFEQAMFRFQRLVDRYPAVPNYFEAHLLLGKSLLEMGKAQEAIHQIEYYMMALGPATAPGIKARIPLGKAYLALGRHHEALFTSEEILKTHPTDLLQLEALLIKTQALMHLNRDPAAVAALASAKKEAPAQIPTPIQGRMALVELQLKTRECARLGSSPSRKVLSLTEAQFREQLERRGSCVLASALVYRDALKTGDPIASTQASLAILESVSAYRNTFENPPPPPGRRTTTQLKQYQLELRESLKPDYDRNRLKLIEFLNQWKQALPRTAESYITKVAQSLGAN